jgi:hypothetical protein
MNIVNLRACCTRPQQQNRMWLPHELATLVGSYLDPPDLRVCTTQLCSSGTGFVATAFTNDATTILLHELIACCRLSAGVEDVAQESINKRIEAFLARRGAVHTIILVVQLKGAHEANASVYAKLHLHFQQSSSFQLRQNQGITVEWHVSAESIAQVDFLLKGDEPKNGACGGDTRAGGAIRQHLHTLDLSRTQVSDVSALATCHNLHKLNLSRTQVSDASPLASCQSLQKLNLSRTHVTDVSALAACESLYMLDLNSTQVSDVSALAACQSLYKLFLMSTPVSDVSALAACQSLHTLNLLVTQVSDVSALASCQSLVKIWGVEDMIGGTDILRTIQNRH